MVKSIIKLEPVTGSHYSCNSCTASKEKGAKLYEIMVGINNQSISTRMCTKCLSKLGDLIWDVLEQEGGEK